MFLGRRVWFGRSIVFFTLGASFFPFAFGIISIRVRIVVIFLGFLLLDRSGAERLFLLGLSWRRARRRVCGGGRHFRKLSVGCSIGMPRGKVRCVPGRQAGRQAGSSTNADDVLAEAVGNVLKREKQGDDDEMVLDDGAADQNASCSTRTRKQPTCLKRKTHWRRSSEEVALRLAPRGKSERSSVATSVSLRSCAESTWCARV